MTQHVAHRKSDEMAAPEFELIAEQNAKIERLRAALHDIGAMVYVDRDGAIRFKGSFCPEDMLNTVNAALKD